MWTYGRSPTAPGIWSSSRRPAALAGAGVRAPACRGRRAAAARGPFSRYIRPDVTTPAQMWLRTDIPRPDTTRHADRDTPTGNSAARRDTPTGDTPKSALTGTAR